MPETPKPPAGTTPRRRRRPRYRHSLGPQGQRVGTRGLGQRWWRRLRRLRRRLGAQRGRVAAVLGLMSLVMGSALAWTWLREQAHNDRAWSRVPPGQSHDGIPLPAAHRLAAALPPDDDPAYGVVAMAEAAASSASAATPTTAAPTPATRAAPQVAGLALHFGCAWGVPGRNPYRGTPEQVLAAARLPPEVIRTVAQRIRAGERTDRVSITNSGIRRHSADIEYDAQRFALSFGRSLCIDARVNFLPGHREEADLYEAVDDRGRTHTVMVPDVCGNVSVLGVDGETLARLAFADAQDSRSRSVSLPGTLAHVLIGLALVGAVRAWRRRPGA